MIPDMHALLRDWPHCLNPEVNRLHDDVDKYLETSVAPINRGELPLTLQSSLFPPGDRLEKMKALNAARFASSWWPYASYEALLTTTYLSIWVRTPEHLPYNSSVDSALVVCLG